jgi:PAS domain S-box-containing protein
LSRNSKQDHLLSLLLANARDLVCIKDTSLECVAVSRSFSDFFGFDDTLAFKGKTLEAILGRCFSGEDELADRQVLDSMESRQVLLQHRGTDGTVHQFQTIKSPLFQADGGLWGILSISRDTTEQEAGLKTLRDEAAVYEAVVMNAPLGVSVRDALGNLIMVNNKWKSIWAISEQNLQNDMSRNRPSLEFDDTDSYLGAYNNEVKKIYTEGGQLSIPQLRIPEPRSGGAMWVSHHFYAIHKPEGSVDKVVVLTEDLTEQVRNRKALEQSQTNYRYLTENVPVGIFTAELRIGGPVLSSNPAFQKMFGFGGQESPVGMPMESFLADPEFLPRALPIIMKSGRADDWEILMRRVDGSDFWGSLTIRLHRTESAAIIQGVITDVSHRRESIERLHNTVMGTVSAMGRLVDMKDPYTAGHQERVAHLAAAIATEAGLSPERTEGVSIAGKLHDIGKMCVPAEILTKPGAVSPEEMRLLKTHPASGYNILRNIEFPWPVAEYVLQHHERLDGSGYPGGLTDREICIEAKILAVADVVEAMATRRPYRAGKGIHEALQTVTLGAGILYDRKMTEICVSLFLQKDYSLPPY